MVFVHLLDAVYRNLSLQILVIELVFTLLLVRLDPFVLLESTLVEVVLFLEGEHVDLLENLV